jgi:ribonuclease HIII
MAGYTDSKRAQDYQFYKLTAAIINMQDNNAMYHMAEEDYEPLCQALRNLHDKANKRLNRLYSSETKEEQNG